MESLDLVKRELCYTYITRFSVRLTHVETFVCFRSIVLVWVAELEADAVTSLDTTATL